MTNQDDLQVGKYILVTGINSTRIRQLRKYLVARGVDIGLDLAVFPTKVDNEFNLIITSSLPHSWKNSIAEGVYSHLENNNVEELAFSLDEYFNDSEEAK